MQTVIVLNRTMAATGVLFFVAMTVWWLPSAKSIWSTPRRGDAAIPATPATPAAAGAPTTEGVAS